MGEKMKAISFNDMSQYMSNLQLRREVSNGSLFAGIFTLEAQQYIKRLKYLVTQISQTLGQTPIV